MHISMISFDGAVLPVDGAGVGCADCGACMYFAGYLTSASSPPFISSDGMCKSVESFIVVYLLKFDVVLRMSLPVPE